MCADANANVDVDADVPLIKSQRDWQGIRTSTGQRRYSEKVPSDMHLEWVSILAKLEKAGPHAVPEHHKVIYGVGKFQH